MSLRGPSDEERLLPPFSDDRLKRIRVYDRRSADLEAVTVDISGLDYNEFLQLLSQANDGYIYFYTFLFNV